MKVLFRLVAILEGLSYIILLFVGVPFKYFNDNDAIVGYFGMPHGILFMAYCIFVLMYRSEYKWTGSQTLAMLLFSIIPFGTFYGDYKYLRPKRQ